MEWINVKDKLPEVGKLVIINSGPDDLAFAHLRENFSSRVWRIHNYSKFVTLENYPYWIPLPEDFPDPYVD